MKCTGCLGYGHGLVIGGDPYCWECADFIWDKKTKEERYEAMQELKAKREASEKERLSKMF